MDLGVGGPRCMGSAADESPDINAIRYSFRFFLFFAPFLSENAWRASGVEKRGFFLHFLTPCEKYGRGGGDVCTNYLCHS